MLSTWLGDIPRATFDSAHFQRAPFANAGTVAALVPFLSWRTVARLADKAEKPDTLIVRNAKLLDTTPVHSFEELRARFAEGCSIVMRRCEQHDPRLRELADAFSRELDGEVVIQLYLTPKGFHSFGWHYDCEDVFIAQTAGQKEYLLRQNTVNPQPRLSAMPRDMQYEQETSPTMASTLIAGDCLYIPRGWWHVARALEDSLSISVGVLSDDAR